MAGGPGERGLRADFLTALAELDFVLLVGGDHPATADAVAEAHSIPGRVGARPFLDLLDGSAATTRSPGPTAPTIRVPVAADPEVAAGAVEARQSLES